MVNTVGFRLILGFAYYTGRYSYSDILQYIVHI